VFLVHAMSVYTGLSLLLVFMLGLRLAGAPQWGLIAAGLYCTLGPAYERFIAGGFLPEDFALPFILGTTVLLLPRDGARGGLKAAARGALGGATAGLAAAFWHASQYPLAALGMLLSLEGLLKRRGREHFPVALGASVAFSAIALLAPVLRAKVFVLSLPGACLWHWTLWSWRREDRPPGLRIRAALWVASFVGLAAAFSLLNAQTGSYSHVFEFVCARLLHPTGAPADPTRISFAARMYWEFDFLSPTPAGFVGNMRLALLFLPFAVLPLATWRRTPGALCVVCGQALILLGWGLLMRRFLFLAVPFTAAASVAGLALAAEGRSFRSVLPEAVRRHAAGAAAGLAAAAVALNVVTIPKTRVWSVPASTAAIMDVLEQVRRSSGPDDAFFASPAWSAVLFTSADRPVVVHPMWESADARDKYRALLEGFFSDEETFWRLLRRTRASYALVDHVFVQGDGPGSGRYKAGRTGPLDPGWAVTRCQFAPEDLEYLDLVSQGLNCRIFRVRDNPAANDPERRRRIRQLVDASLNPLFDPRNFPRKDGGYVSAIATHARIIRSIELTVEAHRLMQSGNARQAAPMLADALAMCSNNMDAHYLLALLHLAAGRADQARAHAGEARRIAPLNAQAAALAERLSAPGGPP
jgi:hypothetical protein